MKGRLMGHLQELRPEDEGPQVINDMKMAQVFLGETELEDDQPFVLAKDRDEYFDVIQADISQHWGTEFTQHRSDLGELSCERKTHSKACCSPRSSR